MKNENHNDDYPWLKKYPEAIDWAAEIELRPVYSILDNTCAKYGDRPAFDFLGKKYNWRQIGDLVDRFAAGLQEIGVQKGHHVGLFLPNSPYYLVAYFAILKAGAVVVNFNPLYPRKELQYQIEDSHVDMMVTLDLAMLYDKMHDMVHQSRLKKLVICRFTDILPFPKNILFRVAKGKEIAKIQHSEHHVWFHDLVKTAKKPVLPAIDPAEDLAVLQYTGGTTGVPKGAMLTHGNVFANVEQAALWFEGKKDGEEKMLGVLPFFHVFAMTAILNLSVRSAFEIIALPRFDLKDTLKIIDKKKPQYFPAVPAIYSAINNCPQVKDYDLTSLRYCISGGAPLAVEVKKQFEEKTGCIVVEGYGLTESSPVVCVNPINGENKAGSIGLPLPGTVVELRDKDDKNKIVAHGERGELCVRGPQVMKGYWNKAEATEKTLRDGLLYTGDVAIMDDDGYVFIVDRLKDMIITNGYNVYPRNVEEAIYGHEAIEECVVAGIPDASRGEIVKAWVKLKEGKNLSGDELKTFLKDHLSPMEIPKRIEIRDEPLPKTMIGKLSRKDLLEEELSSK
jgi:long-chain acyl-CoA synthetase